MTLRFGTDGVRGVAGTELTPELVLGLGRAAARVMAADRLLIGRDTRRSGPMLEAALAAGLASEGAVVERLGVLPTPAVAFLSAEEGVPAAMISASHNPYADNGVKLFAAGGRKLREDTETAVEAELDRLLAAPPGGRADVGPVADREDGGPRYVDHLVRSIEGRTLEGLTVVLDCAHGAAWRVGPLALRELGADVTVLGASPDGVNINAGFGSTCPRPLQEAVVAAGADAGLALDGDADRVIAVDHRGEVVDGDHLIAMCAIDLAARGRLRERTVVVTVMTNLGFHLGMADHGIAVVETPVGDRHVLEAMAKGESSLGGEQSGHVVFADLATTGDGLLTGLQVLDLVSRSGLALSTLAAAAMTRLPQVLRNVPVTGPAGGVVGAVAAEVAAVEAELGRRGRVLIRPSGTEPLVRVMVEAPTAAQAEAAAARLVGAVEKAGAAGTGAVRR